MKTSSIVLASTIENAINRLPNPSYVLTDKRARIDIFHKVARQPDVYGVMQNYRDTLSAMTISIDEPAYEEVANSIDLRAFIRGALSAREYGYAVLECTHYDTVGGRTLPTRVELCPPELFGFDSERQLRIYPRSAPDGIEVFKKYPNKFILLQNEPSLTNPYGVGLLDVAYWLAVGLAGNYEFMMTFAEEDGRDKWVGTYPQDATEAQKTELMDALVKLRNGGAAIKPEGMSIEPKDLNTRTSSGDLYEQIDQMLLRKLSKLWFGTDLLMQVDGKGGYSSANAGIEIKEDAINAGKHLVKTALRKLFQLTDSLAGKTSEQVPGIEITRPVSLSRDTAEIDRIYADMGMRPTKELLLKRGYKDGEFTLAQGDENADSEDFSDQPTAPGDIFDLFTKKKAWKRASLRASTPS